MAYRPEFISLLRDIRDDIYWKIKGWYDNIVLMKADIDSIHNDFTTMHVGSTSTLTPKADGTVADATATFDPHSSEFAFGIPQGEKGAKGDQGHEGLPGIQGVRGDQGLAGPMGNTGQQGIPGVTGPQGPHGPQGVVGPQGHDGIQGQRGASIAGIEFGNVFNTLANLQAAVPHPEIGETHLVKFQADGTTLLGDLYVYDNPTPPHDPANAGWHDIGHIQGPQGVMGPEGPRGKQGLGVKVLGTDTEANIKAKSGNDGDLWVDSKTGHAWVRGGGTWTDVGPFRGPTGVAGPTGPHGPNGQQGHQGPIGHDGPQGIQGKTGQKGAQGIQGVPGPRGAKGEKGNTGPKGSSGVTHWATQAEVNSGIVKQKAMDPYTFKAWWNSVFSGFFASDAVTKTGTERKKAVTPASLKALLRTITGKYLPLTGGTLTGPLYAKTLTLEGILNGYIGAKIDWRLGRYTSDGVGIFSSVGKKGIVVTDTGTVRADTTIQIVESNPALDFFTGFNNADKKGVLQYYGAYAGMILWNQASSAYINVKDSGEIDLISTKSQKVKARGKDIITGTLSGSTLTLELG